MKKIFLTYKLYYCRNNIVARIILIETSIMFSTGWKNVNYREKNKLNEYIN